MHLSGYQLEKVRQIYQQFTPELLPEDLQVLKESLMSGEQIGIFTCNSNCTAYITNQILGFVSSEERRELNRMPGLIYHKETHGRIVMNHFTDSSCGRAFRGFKAKFYICQFPSVMENLTAEKRGENNGIVYLQQKGR